MPETIAKLRSIYLQNERDVWVREPAEPATAEHLTVFLDGEFYRDRVGAVAVIDELVQHGEIADSWFVFVSTANAEARWRECPCHTPFARFAAEELLPWLGERHPELGLVRHKILIGLSYTGLAAAFVACTYPGTFDKVISQSGSFWWNDCWLVRQYERSADRVPTAFYLDVGRRETQENIRHGDGVLQVVSQIDAVRRFRDVLLQQGYVVRYAETDGAHTFEAWRKTLPEALVWALPHPARSSDLLPRQSHPKAQP